VAVDEVRVRADSAPPLPWSQAWTAAAVGPDGFYTRGPGAQHSLARFFRTSVQVGAVFHRAIARLVIEVDERLGEPARLDLIDVGAGDGELLAGVLDALPPGIVRRAIAVAVDVRPAPASLDARVRWVQGDAVDAVPTGLRGLLIAHEWLDDVPLDVVEVDEQGGLRLVLVDRAGVESRGPALDDTEGWAALGLDAAAARVWLQRWCDPPELVTPGRRVEVGLARDEAWRAVAERLEAGTALAVDYGREPHRDSTLVGYGVPGRETHPVPDGSVNITAHVHVESVAAAVGLAPAEIGRQRESLAALGVSARLPPRELALTDPQSYAEALQVASDSAELLDPSGLGGFRWIRLDR
jgi:SAM-dependent MidA family methyltransferase